MTVWVGLTGGIGSGKTQAAACFADLGIPLINADEHARLLTETADSDALKAICEVFGMAALTVSGSLNRVYMRDLVFTDTDARQQLENILHPYIFDSICRQQQLESKAVYGIVELPTLTEHPVFRQLIHRILLIQCPQAVRIRRVMQRSGLTEEQVRLIMDAQATDAERAALADDVIDNSGSMQDLQAAVRQQHNTYCRMLAA